jgi:hypothetical protein
MEGIVMSRHVVSIACVCMSACLFSGAIAAEHLPESDGSTPFQLSGVQLVANTTASGVQVYSCEYDPSHHLQWVFVRPQATLYDAGGSASIEHGKGPSWKAGDGSSIEGQLLSQAPSATPNSIPQLLLRAKSVAGDGSLTDVRFVERLDTVGGSAPSAACTTEHQIGSSPYLARYVFWK